MCFLEQSLFPVIWFPLTPLHRFLMTKNQYGFKSEVQGYLTSFAGICESGILGTDQNGYKEEAD